VDESILGLPPLECARFEIIRRPDPELEPYAVTAFTRSKEQTRALQEQWRAGTLVHLVVRVVVACWTEDDPDHVLVTNLEGSDRARRPLVVDGKPWTGFEMIASKTRFQKGTADWKFPPLPWALTVEEITEGSTLPIEARPAVERNEDREEILADLQDYRYEPPRGDSHDPEG